MINISKEDFCKYIKHMQTAWDADSAVNKIARDSNSEFLGSDLSYLMIDVCELLEKLFNTDYEDVSYFCINADFGRGWHHGMVTDADGNDIDLSTAEKLYDYLVEESGG